MSPGASALPNASLRNARRRLARVARPPVLLGVLIVVASVVGVAATEHLEVQWARDRTVQLAQTAARQESLVAAKAAHALISLRLDDVRGLIAAQERALASTEGFLQ